ncbi:unnamed protein product [Bursaphelenchus xylophilus]|uniref:(pine wood nematode) hypothetical protein n=1 Tax=Bursaphelenchus xylophilus TaxID=6326 RepID=A0A1I7S2G6_BURXY|nr:unnamed protein product [Bursaphelenchus xylophilus]CAG9114568.1 unnamed protein product [Bursaphelenchus xylophilus]
MDNMEDALLFNPLGTLKNQLDFVGHQLVRLLQAIGQSPCECTTCETHLPGKANPMSSGQMMDQLQRQVSVDQKSNNSERAHSEESFSGPLKPSLGGVDLAGFQKGNRRSKYFTEEAKLKVAEYAVIHGASAAARKFGIAPSVAAYYQRKMKKNLTLDPRNHSQYNGDETRRQGSTEDGESGNESPLTPNGNGFNFAFRQRGRPKLIGDDLDAELVEHIVEVKHSRPTLNITASFALNEAKNYIAQKRPEMLEENGGPVNLKITWAMKLVNRVNERYREKYGDIIHKISAQKFDYHNDNQNQILNDQFLKLLAGSEMMNSDLIAQMMLHFQGDLPATTDPISLNENTKMDLTQTQRVPNALSPKNFGQENLNHTLEQEPEVESENNAYAKIFDLISDGRQLQNDL